MLTLALILLIVAVVCGFTVNPLLFLIAVLAVAFFASARSGTAL